MASVGGLKNALRAILGMLMAFFMCNMIVDSRSNKAASTSPEKAYNGAL